MVNLSNTTTTSTTSTAVTWEVNGIVGGNSSVGTILSSTTDNQVGIYTAPSIVPSTNNGQVNITAVAQQPNTTSTTTSSGTTTSTTTSTTNTVTSNTAVVQIGVTPGFSINPSVTSVPAGGTIQFSSILNGVTDLNTTWTVTSSSGRQSRLHWPKNGSLYGTIVAAYGNSITVTGTDGTNSLSDTFSIAFSDHSLAGPYAFSYRGDNQLGFYAVAGSFVTDGNGDIESGVEDIDSFQTGVSTQVPITGNYTVGPDGRGTVHFSDNSNWRFALTTNQHGFMIRSDASDTGSGTIDQQTLNALSTTSPDTVLSGPYVFSGLGCGHYVSARSRLQANFQPTAREIFRHEHDFGCQQWRQRNRGGHNAQRFLLLRYHFPGTGRGVLTLTSTTTGPRTYAFYVTDSTLLHFVEIGSQRLLSRGRAERPDREFVFCASLASGNYAFTAGGNSSAGAYAAGGIFVSNGAGNMTGGAFDGNNAGTVQLNATLTSCPYSVDPATGRIDLKLCGAGTTEFAAYQTASNSALLLELDSTAIATGVAYQQQVATATPSGEFCFKAQWQGRIS